MSRFFHFLLLIQPFFGYLFCWDAPFHSDLTTTVFLPKLPVGELSIKGSASHKWTCEGKWWNFQWCTLQKSFQMLSLTMPNAPSPSFSRSLSWCLGNSGTLGRVVHKSSNWVLMGMCKVVKRSPLEAALAPSCCTLPCWDLLLVVVVVVWKCLLCGGEEFSFSG